MPIIESTWMIKWRIFYTTSSTGTRNKRCYLILTQCVCVKWSLKMYRSFYFLQSGKGFSYPGNSSSDCFVQKIEIVFLCPLRYTTVFLGSKTRRKRRNSSMVSCTLPPWRDWRALSLMNSKSLRTQELEMDQKALQLEPPLYHPVS